VQAKQYNQAYKYLSSSFQENYFNSLEEFEKYAKEKYPDFIIEKYSNIRRQGGIYLIDVEIKDFSEKKETFTQTFILKENDFNNVEIAFNV